MTLNTLFSPAKVNLGLSIVGRRANGYHELESLFWPVTLVDRIHFRQSESFSVRTTMKNGSEQVAPAMNENLVTKALTALGQKHWSVEIEKYIPMGGGLGGGSSNAGAVLRWLGKEANWSPDKLSELALQLGADVPFFLQTRPAWVTGVGEKVNPVELNDEVRTKLSFLLVMPPFGVPTRDVFQAYLKSGVGFTPRQPPPTGIWDMAAISKFLSATRNDLEPPACDLFPALKNIIGELRQTPCVYAGLSGSGSTCFAAYLSATDCENSLQVLQRFLRQQNCRSLRTDTFIG